MKIKRILPDGTIASEILQLNDDPSIHEPDGSIFSVRIDTKRGCGSFHMPNGMFNIPTCGNLIDVKMMSGKILRCLVTYFTQDHVSATGNMVILCYREDFARYLCAAMIKDDSNIVNESQTLGSLISERMVEKNIYEIPGISDDLIVQVKKDLFWTNSIPIILFKNMLEILEITFPTAERAIYNTFNILDKLKKQQPVKMDSTSDLWENKVAMDKYVTRLKELMSHEKIGQAKNIL